VTCRADNEQTIGAIGRWIAERLVGNRNDAASVLAGRFGDQLLDPGAEGCDRARRNEGELVASLIGQDAHDGPERHTRIACWLAGRAARLRHRVCIF